MTGLSLWVTSRSKLDSSRLMVVELLFITLGKVSPNLNNQNNGGNAKQPPAQRRYTFLCWRYRNRSTLGGSVRHGDERLSLFHLNRGERLGGQVRHSCDTRCLVFRSRRKCVWEGSDRHRSL